MLSITTDTFTDIIDVGHYKSLFALPRDKLSAQDHLIGLYTSTLIKDDSCVQIGIGKMGNAIANALMMREKNNQTYRDLLTQLSATQKFGHIISSIGTLTTFEKGLYASSEMISDEFMQLYKAHILKKRVYDHIGLQRLLNDKKINEPITPEWLEILLQHHIISSLLTFDDLKFLKKFGIFNTCIGYESGNLILPTGKKFFADLNSAESKREIIEHCLGRYLKNGKVIHAGFFLGSTLFYEQLQNLSDDELQLIDMTSIARTNALSWNPELLKLQRQQTRFINSTMMLTLDGSIVSDGLENLQEVSGVGGQFDFVNMAHDIKDAYSIINCRSTRMSKNGVQSNIVWDYPNITLPRYLRDIFVTEYGIADCRSKTDAEVIKALLNITDSRFQQMLLKKAKYYGKLPQDYEIPELYTRNLPEFIEPIIHNIQSQGYCKPYPFGSDLTEEENMIEKALLFFKKMQPFKIIYLTFKITPIF